MDNKQVIFHILPEGIKVSTEGEISSTEFLGVLKYAESLSLYTSLKEVSDGLGVCVKGISSSLTAIQALSEMILITAAEKKKEE